MADEDRAHETEAGTKPPRPTRAPAGGLRCDKVRRTEARVDTITSRLKDKAKSLLASAPGLYRPVSAAFRSLGMVKGIAYLAAHRDRIMMGARPILISYPGEPRARWAENAAGHPALAKVIGAGRPEYERLVRSFGALRNAIEAIPSSEPAESAEPSWTNGFFTGLDAVALYGMVATQRPKRYFEIGSGFSTKLARRAIRDQKLPTQLLSIDPSPQAQINALCDTVVRERLEDVDIGVFDQLEANDVLFFDGSHHSFMSSDVVVFFLEILPRLRPGVIVHIHDIFLPYDYPTDWIDRYYTEQYLLAVALMAPQPDLEVVFPAQFVRRDPALSKLLDEQLGARAEGGAASFWLRTRQRG